jgi:DNA-binding transcriptional ArsR family regulator
MELATFILGGECWRVNAVPSDLDLTLAALADPTRRALLERLAGGDARVTDLARPFAISLNSVSKHLRALERAGLVRRRRVGREHVLSLDRTALDRAAAWIAAQRNPWSIRLDTLDALLEAEQAGGQLAPPRHGGYPPRVA